MNVTGGQFHFGAAVAAWHEAPRLRAYVIASVPWQLHARHALQASCQIRKMPIHRAKLLISGPLTMKPRLSLLEATRRGIFAVRPTVIFTPADFFGDTNSHQVQLV